MQVSEYDLVITSGEERTGFMLDHDSSAPSTRAKKTPPLQPGVESGSIYSARDSDPPYPIEYNDWRGGAGQKLFDGDNRRENAFYFSENVAVHEEGELQLGPARWLFPYDTTGAGTVGKISNLALAHSKLWAAFTKITNGDQIRRLTHLSKAQGGIGLHWLSTTSETIIGFVNNTGITAKCFAYCPQHGEIIRIDSANGGEWNVTRGIGTTVPAVHTISETWYIMQWEAAAWSATAPADPCVALASDGDYVYASTHTAGTANGDVYRGKAAGSETADWVSYSAADSIVDLVYSAGLMYGVQATYTSTVVTGLNVGYFGSGALPVAFNTIVGSAILNPGATHVALVELDNYVYWVISNPDRSRVYRVQHSTADTFELVATLPQGFTATCAYALQGMVLVGGYTDTGYLYAADTTHRLEGGVFAIVDGANITKLCTITGPDDEDYSVVALGASHRFINILTKSAVYRYDLETGGYHHLRDVPTTTGLVAGGGPTWSAEAYGPAPDELPDTTPHPYDWTYADSGVTTFISDWQANGYHIEINPKNAWIHYYKDDSAMTSSFTVDAVVDQPESQGAHIYAANSEKLAAVWVKGEMVGETRLQVWVYFKKWTGSAWASIAIGPYDPDSAVWIWMSVDSVNGAQLWINGSKVATIAYADLRPINDTTPVWLHSKRIGFGPGWPGFGIATDSHNESAAWYTVRWSTGGAYPYGYTGGTAVTASKVITSLDGELYMPMPDYYLAFITPRLQADSGSLDTSETTVRTGTKKKRFSSIDVVHDNLQTGQSLSVTPVVDNVPLTTATITGPSEDESPLVTSTVAVNAQGRKIRVKVELADTSPGRSAAQRLHVYNVTAFFTTLPSNGKRSFMLNVSDQAQLRNGAFYDVDPDLAIARLYDMVGSYVSVESIHGDFNAYVESVEGAGAASDLAGGSHQRGRYQIIMTEQP